MGCFHVPTAATASSPLHTHIPAVLLPLHTHIPAVLLPLHTHIPILLPYFAAAPAADYFDGGQHDCQEVLRVMMDLLHDDLVSSGTAGTAWNRRSEWFALPVVMLRW
jgi:hypothetical protein